MLSNSIYNYATKPRRKVRALRDGALLLSVCLSVCRLKCIGDLLVVDWPSSAIEPAAAALLGQSGQ